MARVFVDNQSYEMDASRNLLEECLSRGMNLPYFCWHPAMGSVGACRQCAVMQFKDEEDTKGRLVMACMTPAADGTRISIADPYAVEFRRMIVEGLMLNHPHDCPVCDEGGECHLQDMTVMTGHDYRRYRFEKRTYRNQYLGPFVNHEMNRCIQCYRCVRFYRDYAGGRDLNAFSLRDRVFFGRESDGVLENEFAGNLVEVCPTGVFTDRTLAQHYTRKWDLEMAPSICVHCGLGCNTTAGARYGSMRRIVNRYHRDINGYFLCDRGRYGYEFVNSPRRVRRPRFGGQVIGLEAAFERVRGLETERTIGIGSPRASLESNFALRQLVGADRFYAGIPRHEHELVRLMIDILRAGPARAASLKDVEESDAVLVLGEDVANTAPRMALSLRQSVRRQPEAIAARQHIPLWMDQAVREAVQDARGPLYIVTTAATRLDEIATRTFRASPDEVAAFGHAVAAQLAGAGAPERFRPAAEEIAAALGRARRPLVVSGQGSGSAEILRAAAQVAGAIPGAALALTPHECNTFGLGLMDAPPLEAAFEAKADAVIVLENDLYRRAPAATVERFLARFSRILALDHLENATTQKAGLVLPAATFAEGDGTLVNHEGRAQRFFQMFVPDDPILESWRWLGQWEKLDDVLAAMAAVEWQLAGAAGAAPPATFRIEGAKVAREPHRYSGRTAMFANITVQEPPPPPDLDSPLSFSMEGASKQPPAPLLPFFWAPGWNSIQAVNKFQEEIGGPLRGDHAGVRLIETGGPAPLSRLAPSSTNGSGTAPREGAMLAVPLYEIFGSEELSREAPAVAELSPSAYAALGPEDAARFGGEVTVLGNRVRVRVAPELTPGIMGLPVGIPPFIGISLPAWIEVA